MTFIFTKGRRNGIRFGDFLQELWVFPQDIVGVWSLLPEVLLKFLTTFCFRDLYWELRYKYPEGNMTALVQFHTSVDVGQNCKWNSPASVDTLYGLYSHWCSPSASMANGSVLQCRHNLCVLCTEFVPKFAKCFGILQDETHARNVKYYFQSLP